MTLALYGKSRRRQYGLAGAGILTLLVAAIAAVLWLGTAGATPSSVTGAVNTTTSSGTVQNGNTAYQNKCDVYLRSAQQGNSNLGPDGTWYIRVTDPNGNTVLTPSPGYIVATLSGGKFVSYVDSSNTTQPATNDVVPLCAIGTYATTPNPGGVYKAWASTSTSFENDTSKTDNFKVTSTAQITVKKVVSGNASSDTDTFGGTLNSQSNQVVKTFTDLSQNSPKVYTDIAPGTYYVTETNNNGYTLLGYAAGNSDGNCPAEPASTTATSVTVTVAAGDEKVLCIYNQKNAIVADTGTVIVKKVLSGGASSASDQFTGTLNSQVSGVVENFTDLSGNNSKTYTGLPAGTYYTVETGQNGYALLGYAAGNSDGICPGTPTSTTASSVTVTIAGGQTKVLCIYNQKNSEQTLEGRKIRIGKVTSTATHPAASFSGTISPGGVPTTFSGLNLAANGGSSVIQDINFDNQNGQTVTETNLPTGWTLDGYNVSSDPNGTNTCSTTMPFTGTNTVPAGAGTYLVCIKNTYTPPPTGSLVATKSTTVSGIPTPQERSGWTIWLQGCGYGPVSQVTDAAGKATFSKVPLCASYTVSEDLNSAPVAGYTPVTPAVLNNIPVTAGPATQVSFTNNRNVNIPICLTGCLPVILTAPTATPPPPTPTPTLVPPTATPTNTATPVRPTPSSNTDVVEGAKTPGAPSTGSGMTGSGSSSTNVLLAVVGLFAIAGGSSLLALGRRRR